MGNIKFTCCNQNPIWVDNVPGKEYWYCSECKQEVIEPKDVIDQTMIGGGSLLPGIPDDINDWDNNIWDMVYKLYKP